MKTKIIEELRNPQWTYLPDTNTRVLDPASTPLLMREASIELEKAFDRIEFLEDTPDHLSKSLINRLRNPTFFNGQFKVEGNDGVTLVFDMPPVLSTAHTLTDMRVAADELEKLADLVAEVRLVMSEREELLYQAASDLIDLLDKPGWGPKEIKQVKAKREELRGALKAYEAPEDAPPPPPEDVEESSD